VNEERDGNKEISTARRSLGIEIGIAYPLSFPSFPLPPSPISTLSLLQNLLYFFVSASFYFSSFFYFILFVD
jgi:hypothetical protein